jgi:hypothetical protein
MKPYQRLEFLMQLRDFYRQGKMTADEAVNALLKQRAKVSAEKLAAKRRAAAKGRTD